jgi:hypothetical protein
MNSFLDPCHPERPFKECIQKVCGDKFVNTVGTHSFLRDMKNVVEVALSSKAMKLKFGDPGTIMRLVIESHQDKLCRPKIVQETAEETSADPAEPAEFRITSSNEDAAGAGAGVLLLYALYSNPRTRLAALGLMSFFGIKPPIPDYESPNDRMCREGG